MRLPWLPRRDRTSAESENVAERHRWWQFFGLGWRNRVVLNLDDRGPNLRAFLRLRRRIERRLERERALAAAQPQPVGLKPPPDDPPKEPPAPSV